MQETVFCLFLCTVTVSHSLPRTWKSWSLLHVYAPRLSRIPILYQNEISPCATSSPSRGTLKLYIREQKYIDFKLATTTRYIIIHTHINALSVLPCMCVERKETTVNYRFNIIFIYIYIYNPD